MDPEQRTKKLWRSKLHLYGIVQEFDHDATRHEFETARSWIFGEASQRVWGVFFEARPKRDFGEMCTVGCDSSSGSEEEAVPYNIWNALLPFLVHFRVGEALQLSLTAEEVGKVALTCRFVCDALCAELYDWDEVETRLVSTSRGVASRRCRPPATCGRAGRLGPRRL